MSTFAQIVSDCGENLDRVNLPAAETARIKKWINQVIREDICNKLSFQWMEREYEQDITEDEGFYAAEHQARHKNVLRVSFRKSSSDRWHLLNDENPIAFDYHYQTVESGSPRGWRRYYESHHKGFRVRELPSGDTATDGWKFLVVVEEYPAELINDLDTNLLLTEWSKIIEILVTARGFLHYNQPNDYQAFQNVANIEIDKLLTNERNRKMPAVLTMRRSSAAGRPASGRRRGLRYLGRAPYPSQV